MDKFPLLWEGTPVGELTTEREALYTWFSARCRLPEPGLWCVWAVGTEGELRIGVLEPAGDHAGIRRRFSDRMTVPVGTLLRGELRGTVCRPERWKPVEHPEQLFQTLWLKRQLRGTKNALLRKESSVRILAIPYDAAAPFPLPALFCFARILRIGTGIYAAFAFDEKDWPVFI